MKCPHCSTANPDGVKYCLECGARLICNQCGSHITLIAKFCPQCGAPLTQPSAAQLPPAAQAAALDQAIQRLVPREYIQRLLADGGRAQSERRQVTILFSDVKGSTALGEKLDPEDLLEIINPAFEFLIAPVYRYEGTLARLMGDAILAFFGAPLAHEDDPERAVRAALEIIAGAQEYAQRLESERGIPGFNVRVGINTGLVVVGEVGADYRVEYTAIGDAINLAARMEQNAPVGGILISHDTYRHIRGAFDVEPQALITVKGRSQPVQTYRVLAAKPRPFHLGYRGVEGVETRMIGREAELKALQDALIEVIQESACRMITVSGEAGVGKSRLLYEFESWAELRPERLRYFKGRARPEAQSQPFGLLRDLFSFRFQIQDSDSADTARATLERGLSEMLGNDETSQMKAHFIGQLLGFDFGFSSHLRPALHDAKQIAERALAYLSDFFMAVASQAPVLILLEDVHWADDSSLDALNQLGGRLAEQPALVIALARPTLYERRPHWGEGQLYHTSLKLPPLSKTDTRSLVAEVLQKLPQVPEALRELVVGNAEGNPFYVEELIKMLIEEGVIVKDEPAWQARPELLEGLHIPPTLTGVLQARLDSLSHAERAVIQQAAVIGRVFWDAAVAYIQQAESDSLSQGELSKRLAALRHKELVFQRETSAFVEATEHIFKHAILRDVTYETVLKRLRRPYHARAAEWLVEHSRERQTEFAGLIAEHLERAGQAEQALDYLFQAGEHALACYATGEAHAYFTRILVLLPEDALEHRFDVLLLRCKVYESTKDNQARQADLQALDKLALQVSDPGRIGRLRLHWARFYETNADYPQALSFARQAVDLAEKAGDIALQAETHAWIAWLLYLSSEWNVEYFSIITNEFTRGMQLAQQAGLTWLVSRCLRGLAGVAADLSDWPQANAYYEQALFVARQVGDIYQESAAYHGIAVCYLYEEDFLSAQRPLEQSRLASRNIGIPHLENHLLILRSLSARQAGELESARQYGELALAMARLIGDKRLISLALGELGYFFMAQEDYLKAQDYLEQADSVMPLLDERVRNAHAKIDIADALSGQYRWEEAEALYLEAFEMVQDLKPDRWVLGVQARDFAGLGRTSLAQGRLAEAGSYVARVVDYLDTNPEYRDCLCEGKYYLHWSILPVLQATGDPRADEILEFAYRALQEQAALIPTDEARRMYLENIPWHREIVKLYEAKASS